MWQTHLQPIITYLHNNPHWAAIIVFFITCGEAMAVIGTIIPGSVTLTAVGALVGARIIPVWGTLIAAMLGAISGDFISYWIGLYYQKRIYKIWPFTKYPSWLERGEKFFAKHGGKSIIIGRFFGPARSMVPLIAGTLNMGRWRFFFAAVPSASAWAVAYLIPGILLGALSLEFPPSLAIEFVANVLIFLALFVFCTWLAHYSYKHFARKVDREVKATWHYLQREKPLHWIVSLLTDPKNPENHRQLILAVYTILTGTLFLLVMLGVVSHKAVTVLNIPVYSFLTSLRTSIIDNVMLAFTLLGSKEVMLTSGLLIFLWMAVKRYWRAAFHWLAIVALAAGGVETIKAIFFSARPGHLLAGPINSSFPSGHTTLAVSLFGFLAVLISQELDIGKRRHPFVIAMWLASLVALSRLYLGAHWLSDIFGAFLLGATLILLVTISYRRSYICYLPLRQLLTVTIGSFVLAGLLFGVLDFTKSKHDYTLYWPTTAITSTAWQQHDTKALPLYRANRFGYPVEALNIEWQTSNLAIIKHKLLAQGWQEHDTSFSIAGFIDRLEATTADLHIPFFPQLYHNKVSSLLMTKKLASDGDNDDVIILQLWPADVTIQDPTKPLWIGTVNYYYHPHRHWLILHKKKFLAATDALTPFLKGFTYKAITYPQEQQDEILHRLHWDGKLLLIGTN